MVYDSGEGGTLLALRMPDLFPVRPVQEVRLRGLWLDHARGGLFAAREGARAGWRVPARVLAQVRETEGSRHARALESSRDIINRNCPEKFLYTPPPIVFCFDQGVLHTNVKTQAGSRDGTLSRKHS